MFDNKKIVAVIPARGGSKGLPKKNIKKLCSKPLIGWTIEQAKNSEYIDEVYVSTDDDEIILISKKFGANIIKRPKELSGDQASTESALLHSCEELKNNFDVMLLLQCTSPLRYVNQIDSAIELFFKNNFDSLLSGYKNDSFYWDLKGNSLNYDYKLRPRRQDKLWEFVENGSFYIFKKNILLENKNRLGGKIGQYLMPKWMSFEIDDYFDFELIEYLMKKKFLNEMKFFNLNKIKLVLFDVDGIFTSGLVNLDSEGNETLEFSRIDGKGIELLKKNGFKLGVISAEDSKIVKLRMTKLGIDEVHLGIKDKLNTFNYLKNKYSLNNDEIVFCGDDVQDLPIIEKVGLSFAPKNAREEVKSKVTITLNSFGGKSFVRDVCDILLKNE